ncbi:uncharacterized protein JCM6883_007055 [Sporobolomyces salmoneus]|uniref:uncharacterized protein n=1 Tax=Sporobolomyces salmoneus TaxID=183962 RepID=UPI00317CF051
MTFNPSTSTFRTEELRSALPRLTDSPPSSPPSTTAPFVLTSSPKRIRSSPPRVDLPRFEPTWKEAEDEGMTIKEKPILFIQPASPAMSDPTSPPPRSPMNATFSSSPTVRSSSTPFPLPIPSTSNSPVSSPIRSHSTPFPSIGGGPSSPIQPLAGGGLAARRAAKLGKKRLSLIVPTSSHPISKSLLSPTTPSHLSTSITSTSNDSPESTASSSLLEAAETRSLPPSPISLVTFIGTEGAEQPDRTIGRLMLKQQADEMREQMRGGRGMKRRTSIPRLNLAAAASSSAPMSSNPSMALNTVAGGGGKEKVKPSLSLGKGGNTSAVQFLRRDANEETDPGGGGAEVEEFPYALGPREILPGIWLGSEQNAKDPRVLKDWEFGFVLNVAKEVDCPWVDEEVEPELGEEEKETEKGKETVSPPRKHKHRRTKTQAAIDVRNDKSSNLTESRPVRPPFIRPTASTPNLQSVFKSSSNSTAPPVPPVPKVPLPSSSDASEEMLRSLSSSPPNSVPRRSPPRVRLHPHSNKVPPTPASSSQPPSSLPPSTCRSKGVVRFPTNRQTGRPSIEYLWLKWGHDEADLVEAQKFQSAFDFLDEARDRGEKVLVHCQCGVSRSATVVIAYCMREAAKALEEGRDAKELSGCTGMHDTYSFVKEKSEWVGPNLGLVFQLVAYERTLRGDSNDPADEEENGYPHYPPEPVSSAPSVDSRFPTYHPYTPTSLDGSTSRSQFSTPDLNLPLSPTFSSGTQPSSVTSTPISIQLSNGVLNPQIATPGDQVDSSFESVRGKHGSSKTLKGEPAVFVLSPPPVPPTTSERTLRDDLVSPTVSNYPSSASLPSPLELPTKGRTTRRPPPISLNGQSLAAHSLVPSPTTFATPPASAHTSMTPSLSLPTLTTTGLSTPPSSSLARSPSGVLSPDSAITTSSDSGGSTTSGNSTTTATATPGSSTVKKFGAQSKSERRASHRRVFSETIQVPSTLIKPSWSTHSLHSAGNSNSNSAAGQEE